MAIIDPVNHQRDLRNDVDRNGWDVEAIETPEHDRIHAMWRLQSRWAPVGTIAHVAFIADPEDERRAYGVVVDRNPPRWNGPGQSFNLSPHWDREKAGILAAIAGFRG